MKKKKKQEKWTHVHVHFSHNRLVIFKHFNRQHKNANAAIYRRKFNEWLNIFTKLVCARWLLKFVERTYIWMCIDWTTEYRNLKTLSICPRASWFWHLDFFPYWVMPRYHTIKKLFRHNWLDYTYNYVHKSTFFFLKWPWSVISGD